MGAPERRGDRYVVNGGQDPDFSTAKVGRRMIRLTLHHAALDKRAQADRWPVTRFLLPPLDRSHVEVREIEKMGRKAVDSNQVFIDNLEVPAEDRIGEEGQGFKYIIDGFNPERILVAVEAIKPGRAAPGARRAAQ